MVKLTSVSRTNTCCQFVQNYGMFQSKTVNSSTVAYSLFSLAFGKRMLIFSFSFWLVGILSEIFNHNIKYTVGIQVPYNAALTFI